MCRGSGFPVRIISSLPVVEWRIASCLSYLALIPASIQVQGSDFDSISIVNMLADHIRHFANFYSCLPNILRCGKLQLLWCYFSVLLKSWKGICETNIEYWKNWKMITNSSHWIGPLDYVCAVAEVNDIIWHVIWAAVWYSTSDYFISLLLYTN